MTTAVPRSGRRFAATASVLAAAMAALALAGCGSGPAPAPSPSSALVVKVEGGRVAGSAEPGLRVFRGIPYAAAPVGGLRWRPPQPVVPWTGVRPCTSYGSSCPQSGSTIGGGSLPASESEDCLFLNVWTPATTAHERLPVMVWIHGGGFITGSGSLPAGYGEDLSRGEHVVVVSFNYRLGVFGFFAHPALSAESPLGVSGNYGLLDQQAALRWVRRNIAAFGGDPDRVTIFGQSAGGQSVVCQLVSPSSRGLFTRAIAESPRYEDRGVGLWSTLSLREQEQEGEEIGDGLGIPKGDDAAPAALRAVPAARLLEATVAASRGLPLLFVTPPQPSFQPVVDGSVLPGEPWRLLRAGRWARVPLLVGSNRDECNMWLTGVKPADADKVARAARRRVAWFTGPRWTVLGTQFPAVDYGGLLPATSRMMTVLEFNGPVRYLARAAAAQGVPSFLYYFTRVRDGDPPGVPHSAEVPYVFAVVAAGGKGERSPAADVRLSARVSHYWATFAATGDPNATDLPRWPRYDPAADVLLRLDAVVRAAKAPYVAACAIAEAADQTH